MLPYVGGTAVGAFLAFVGYVFARKSGLTPLQSEYLNVMKATNLALQDRLKLLEESLKTGQEEVARLRAEVVSQKVKVRRLERTVAAVVAENVELRQRLGLPGRVDGDEV